MARLPRKSSVRVIDIQATLGMLDVETRRKHKLETCYEEQQSVDEELVTINISGEVFQTYRSTLQRYPNTLLGNMDRLEELKNKDTGEVFLNRNRASFDSILYYYQSEGTLFHPPHVPLKVFLSEMIFFEMGADVIEDFQISKGFIVLQDELDMPRSLFFRKLWSFLEYPNSSKSAKIFALVSMVVIMMSLALFVILTLPEFDPIHTATKNETTGEFKGKHETWVFCADTSIIIFFTMEFALRLLSCPNKFVFCTTASNVIDFLAILPYYLPFLVSGTYHSAGPQDGVVSLLRVVRVVRVLKLARHSRGIQLIAETLWSSRQELMLISFVLFILILICGSTLYYSEQHVPGTTFTSIPQSAWWALVSISTVGFGDMYPTTLVGKMIGGMTMLSAVLMMALPVPSVVSNFLHISAMEANRRKTKPRND